MFLTMLVVALLPLGITWYSNYRATTDQISSQVEQRLSGVSNHLATFVDGWVDMNRRMLNQNSALADIRSMEGNRQTPVLEQIVAQYDWNYLAFTVDNNGNNIGRSDGKSLTFYGDRSYVKQVLQGAPLGRQVLIGKTSGKPAFVLAAPIKNTGGELEGVLAIAMTIADLSKRITNTKIGETGRAFLLDETGKIIAHQSARFTRERKDFSEHPAFQAITKTGLSNIRYSDENGQDVIAFMQKTDQGWIMVAEQTRDEAFASIQEAIEKALLILVITIFFVGTVAYLLSQMLTRPIRSLTHVANEISHGRLDTKISEATRGDELGALARSIERLGVSVKYAIHKLSKQRHAST